METTITLKDLLQIILYVAGAGVLVYLAMFLKNLVKITGTVKDLLDENEVAINDTLKELPIIAGNAEKISGDVSKITGDVNGLVEEVKPQVEKLAVTVGDVGDTVDGLSKKVDTVALRVSDTVVDISDTISDTAKTISINANNVIDYFYILREVLEALRDVLFKK